MAYLAREDVSAPDADWIVPLMWRWTSKHVTPDECRWKIDSAVQCER